MKGSVNEPIATPIMVIPICVPAINGDKLSEIFRISFALPLPFLESDSNLERRTETKEYSPPTKNALPTSNKSAIAILGPTPSAGSTLMMVR